jgi:biopolymer transport protein ExbD
MPRKSKSRGIPEINSGSMADIAFLLLIFFLVTTTIENEYGIRRELPRRMPENTPPPPIKKRNVLLVFVNANNYLLVNDEYGDIRLLKDRVKEFILNPRESETLSEKHAPEMIDGLFTFRKSKGVVALQNDRLTSYKMYIRVQDVLTQAFNELRNDLAREKFGVSYKDLMTKAAKGATDDIKEEAKRKARAVEKAIPMAISEAEPNKR